MACGEEGEALVRGRGVQDLRAEEEQPWPYSPDRKDIWLISPVAVPSGLTSVSTALLVHKAI